VAPPSILGNFFENLTFAVVGGISAELLSNPTFARDPHLLPGQKAQLLTNGSALVALYLSGGDPAILHWGWGAEDPAILRRRWWPTPLCTGFGVSVLDDATAQGIPFAWGPLGYPGGVTASAGRLGGAVRLLGGDWPSGPEHYWPVLEDGPAGIRQGVFLPIKRCRAYKGDLWVRIGVLDPAAQGEVEVGFRRRLATPDGRGQAGERLGSVRVQIRGAEWVKLPFALELQEGQVAFGEPVDFYLRWLPRSNTALHLLVDRAFLLPQDEEDGLDPEVVALVRNSTMPQLRWPGGNYVSYHHWRDAVGPVDLRATYPNYAWGGLDYNLFGTDEYITFCRKLGIRPHITVNQGTGTAEEAAAWVEYCNGDETTPMGKLRARNGHPEPYNVTIWEVGNEIFGTWQGGFVSSDENARRFSEFAPAMRAASPIPIELIACGNNFDFADEVGLGYDHTHADRRWHDQLLKQAPEQIDYISLHSLPVNDLLLENVSDEEAHNAVLGQVTTWERRFLPDLLARAQRANRPGKASPIKLAITEWGPLGGHPNRLNVHNFGAVVYAGAFLNMVLRNADRIPIALPNGFMHGGCIRKAYGVVYYDPQFFAMQQYTPFIGTKPLACELTGPGYDVPHPCDLGAKDSDIPFVDAVVCQSDHSPGLLVAAANKHLTRTMELVIQIPGYNVSAGAHAAVLAYPEITAMTNPVQPDLFQLGHIEITPVGDMITIQLPPFSAAWITL
jgi:alpha-N-arabinofuranosidase